MRRGSILLQLLKMLGAFCLAYVLVSTIFSLCGFTEMVETTSEYYVEVESSENSKGNGDVSDSSNDENAANGIDGDHSVEENEQQKVTETYSSEDVRKDLLWVVTVLAILLAVATVLLADYNTVQRWKTKILQMRSDVEAEVNKRESMLIAAERVTNRYMQHEENTLSAVAASRGSAGDSADTINDARELRAVLEAYPTLQSNESVNTLLKQIEKSENDLVTQRKKFNRAVAKFNALIHSFPLVIFRRAARLTEYDIEADAFVGATLPVSDTKT